jgi:hypothetical protein
VRSSLLHEGGPRRAEEKAELAFDVDLSCVFCRDHDTKTVVVAEQAPALKQAHRVGTQCAVQRGLGKH